MGAGAELRQALGTAVFAGMIGVTVFGLVFTPVFYVICRWLAGSSARPNTRRRRIRPSSIEAFHQRGSSPGGRIAARR